MGQLPKGLILQRNENWRHECIVLIWNMRGANELPALEYISENISRYGHAVEEYLNGQVNWLDKVCEEDRKRVNQDVCQFLLRASGTLTLEFRIKSKEGVVSWVETDSCYIKSEDGETAYVETILRDITKSKTREQMLMENQRALQKEIFTYMDVSSEKSLKENLIDFIKEQRIETLQAAFSGIYGIHAALIGRDYHFYTSMTGPREEAGIFYDVAEQRNFRRKIAALEEILDTGQRNVILSMQNPDIKISGVPVFHKNEYVATWVMCCLEEKNTEEILKILEFMRIMAETITEYYNNHVGVMSAKGYAFERYRLQKKVQLQENLLELYDEMAEKSLQEKLKLILAKAGKVTNAGRCTLYEAVPNSIYARCVSSWLTQEASWNEMERVMYDVQALPNPEVLLEKQEIVVLDSIRIPSEWRDTMCDLYASAAVLLPIEWNGKKGFLSFQEIGQERVWEEESIWFFKEIKKIIVKALLKSE